VAWTYSEDPGTSTSAKRRDAVRLAVGDTHTSDQVFSDAEIAYFLSQAGDAATADCVREAAILACEAAQAKYARQVDTTHGKLSVGASKRIEHFERLAKNLRAKRGRLAEVYAGGRSVAEKQSDAADTDLVQPAFEVGQDDYESGASRWGDA
jgi:hypothetical protein